MGRLFVEYLPDECGARFVCAKCSCEVSSDSQLVWEGFMGAQQPAILFRAALNVEPAGAPREEHLSTGTYTLVDVRCRACETTLGWRYLRARSADQRYKEGASLLQQEHLKRCGQPAAPPALLSPQQRQAVHAQVQAQVRALQEQAQLLAQQPLQARQQAAAVQC